MVSRKLMGVWAVLDFLLLAAGAVALALSIVWRRPDILMNMVLSNADLTGTSFTTSFGAISKYGPPTAGSILGIALIVTFFISITGVVQRNHITIGLVITNYALLIDAIGIVIIGTFVWFFTLQERANFYELWKAASPDVRLTLQDKVSFLLRLGEISSE